MATHRQTLKAWRGEMTQQQLAVKVGVSVSTIANIEANRHAPSWSIANRIAEAVGASLDAIIWSDQEPKPKRKKDAA